MKRLSPEAKVGLLVMMAVLLLAYMSLRLGTFAAGGEGGYSLFLLLENAAGVSKDGDVLVAGIDVGSIEDVRLHDHKALLVLRIQNRVKLPRDSTASVKTHGVLGEKYVEVVPGSATELLRDGEWLRSGAPPGDLDRLLANLNEISADVKRVTERLASVFGSDQGERSLREILEGFRGLSVGLRDVVAENRAALRESLQNLRTLTADVRLLVEANRQNIDQGLASARKLADTLSESAPRITNQVEKLTTDLDEVLEENRENLRQTLANLRDATGRLSTTLDTAQSLMASAQNPKGTLGRLMHDDALYEDLHSVVGDLRSVLGRMEKGEGSLGQLLT
ncbi:MAG: MCE family protein, partial [Deltaproteobacteria bacterium]|nr:MCE family protein [Deltaproteobacteria bacterium]